MLAVEGYVHKPDEMLRYPPYLATGASWIRSLGQENIPPSHAECARVVLSFMSLWKPVAIKSIEVAIMPCAACLHAPSPSAHSAVWRTLTSAFPPFRGFGFPGFRLELGLGGVPES